MKILKDSLDAAQLKSYNELLFLQTLILASSQYSVLNTGEIPAQYAPSIEAIKVFLEKDKKRNFIDTKELESINEMLKDALNFMKEDSWKVKIEPNKRVKKVFITQNVWDNYKLKVGNKTVCDSGDVAWLYEYAEEKYPNAEIIDKTKTIEA